MTVHCEKCGLIYDDENRWTICPHGPLWAPSDKYCRRCDLVHLNGICPATKPGNIGAAKVIDGETIEGRYFLYNFDFPRFRRAAEETMRPVSPFQLIGICWKFRFHGGIQVWIDGKHIADLITKEHADGYPMLTPYPVKMDDDICVKVSDYQRRSFRWFRPNRAHVTLEVLEQVETEKS